MEYSWREYSRLHARHARSHKYTFAVFIRDLAILRATGSGNASSHAALVDARGSEVSISCRPADLSACRESHENDGLDICRFKSFWLIPGISFRNFSNQCWFDYNLESYFLVLVDLSTLVGKATSLLTSSSERQGQFEDNRSSRVEFNGAASSLRSGSLIP
jgi:hypothetical protein